MNKNVLKKKMGKMWKTAKKDLNALLRQTTQLIKKGEKHLEDTSRKGHAELQIMNLTLQKEKLYYELGKLIGSSPRNIEYAKKRFALSKKIREIDKKIKQIKKEETKQKKIK